MEEYIEQDRSIVYDGKKYIKPKFCSYCGSKAFLMINTDKKTQSFGCSGCITWACDYVSIIDAVNNWNSFMDDVLEEQHEIRRRVS